MQQARIIKGPANAGFLPSGARKPARKKRVGFQLSDWLIPTTTIDFQDATGKRLNGVVWMGYVGG